MNELFKFNIQKLIKMWCDLFYDKYAGDHGFKNEIASVVSMEDFQDGSFLYYENEEAIQVHKENFSENFIIPYEVLDHNIYKLKVYTRVVKGLLTIYTVVSVNKKILEHCVINKIPIPIEDFLKNLCRYHQLYTDSNKLLTNSFYYNSQSRDQKIQTNTEYIVTKNMTPVDYTFHDKVDDPKNITEQLYDYQKCSIHWMLEKEKNKKTVKYNMNAEVILGNVYYDLDKPSFNLVKDRTKLIFYGGGLIDEVGLGKTVQIIALSILNPTQSTEYTRSDCEDKFFSRATLVMCPNQLCGQWNREFKKMVSKDYGVDVISLMTKRDFDKYTYQDLLDADFVIVSYQFLDNPVFTLPWSQKVSTYKNFNRRQWTQTDRKSVEETFKKMGKELVSNPIESLMKTNPMIQLIKWHRLVIDEFHEKDSNSKYTYVKNIVPYVDADYRWCVTATPFITNESLYHTVDFLTGYVNQDGNKILTNEQFVDYLSEDCFRRNTKKSVEKEHTLPPIQEEIRWLKFTTTERMMYNAYLANPNNDKFSIYLRQLCCHPQLADETKHCLSNCKSLQDIEKMMVSHYKKEVDAAQDKIDKIEGRIKKVKKRIRKIEKKQKKQQKKKLKKMMDMSKSSSDSESDSSGSSNSDDELDLAILMAGIDNDIDISQLEVKPSNTLDNLKESVEKLEQKLAVAKNEWDGKNTTFEFFNNVVSRLRKTVTKETDPKKSTNITLGADTNVMNFLSQFDNSSSDSDDNSNSEDEETCGICLGEIPEDDVGVTKCGHIFCYECLKISVSRFHNCPYCKKNLKDTDIFILSYEKKKSETKKNPEDKAKDELINEVGTKLANLIFFLRETKEHTIIFSQWDDLLKRVGRILDDNGVKNVFCKGNCYQRDKAIREFNEDDKIKVIMLSSESTASGTNLTKASQVVFIDPIYGSYKYRKDQERQAVGRAHRLGQKKSIKIIRFIIQNSVEEEIFRINLEEDAKHIDSKDAENMDEIQVE